MTFLTPGLALLAAGIGVPALILLHVLRLRRFPQRVPSTLLWRRSVQELEANVPFQRLRVSWLFVLQLLALLCAALAAGQPVWRSGEAASSLVIVLDARARMRAAVDAPSGGETTAPNDGEVPKNGASSTEGGSSPPARAAAPPPEDAPATSRAVNTRFERAVERARALLNQRADRDTEVHLVIARASPGLAASGSPGAIAEALDRVVPTDEPGDAADAMALAAQIAPDAEIHWVGDARGHAEANVGLTMLSAQRNPREPGTVDVLVAAVNSGTLAVEVPLVVTLDGATMAARAIRLPAATERPGEPGRASVLLRVPERPGALLEARIAASDALPLDDVAGLRFAPAAPIRVSFASGDPAAAEHSPVPALLNVMEGVRMERSACGDLAAPGAAAATSVLDGVDLIVADGCLPFVAAGAASRDDAREGTPAPPWIVFAWDDAPRAGADDAASARPDGARTEDAAARDAGAAARSAARRDTETFRAVVSGAARAHPVMQGVPTFTLDVVAPPAARFDGQLPRGAVPLFVDRDAVLAYVDPGGPGIRFRFPLSATDWPAQPTWVMAMQNAVQWLVGQESDGAGEPIRTGATARVLVERSDGSRAWVRLAPPARTGMIDVRAPDGAVASQPVSLLDETQSDLRFAPPPPDPRGFERRVAARDDDGEPGDDGDDDPASERGQQALWPWFAMAALALLVLEWIVYLAALNRRAW